jgi:Regulator of chromosome condensation (RCC1) repeat/Bacterial Ig-like domain (group 2)
LKSNCKFVFAILGAITAGSLVGCGGGGGSPSAVVPSSSSAGTLSVLPSSYTDYWGYTVQMQAPAKDINGNLIAGGNLAWVSSDNNIATVDASGLVTLKSPGNVDITVSSGALSSAVSKITVEGLSGVLATAAEDNCGTSESRTQILCWGNGYPINPNRPLQLQYVNPTPLLMGAIPAGTQIKQIAPSVLFSCALTDGGDAYCWRGGLANSELSALGTNSGTDPNTPQKVVQGERPAGVTFKKIQVNRTAAACGIGSDNEVYCWGKLSSRAVANKPTLVPSIYDSPKKMARGSLSSTDIIQDIELSVNTDCGLTQAGKPFCWLSTNSGAVPTFLPAGAIPSNTKLVQLKSDKFDFHVALGDDGWAYTWGSQNYRAGDGRTDINGNNTTPKRVAQGQIPVTERITNIGAGGIAGANCVLTNAGFAYCWGKGYEGALGNGNLANNQDVAVPTKTLQGGLPTSVKYVDINCGEYHCAALGSDKKIYSWGYNEGAALGIAGKGSGTAVEISRINKL